METPQTHIKIGLALGGGGAKGIAHVGVLRALEKHGIPIASIVGSSAGAVVGGAYALGLSPDEIYKRGATLQSKNFLRIGNFHLLSESLIKNKDIDDAIFALVGDRTFAETKIPFAATAVDLESGQEVLLTEGSMRKGILASSAIPGILSPVFFNTRYLVDGGLVNNLPVNHFHGQKDVDIVIGVELGSFTSRQYISAMVWERYYKKPDKIKLASGLIHNLKENVTLMMHIMLRAIDIAREQAQEYRMEKGKADLLIKPDVENISLLEFGKAADAVAAGEKAAEAVMPQILALIEEKKKQKAATLVAV